MLLAMNNLADHFGFGRLTAIAGLSSTVVGAFSTGFMSTISLSAIMIAPLFLLMMRFFQNYLFLCKAYAMCVTMRSLLWEVVSRVRHVTLGGGSGGLPVVVCGCDGSVFGFAGRVSNGLQIEEFYDFVGGNRSVVWAHACNTLQVAVK